MFYVKHLTHAHFVRGRTYIIGASRSEPHSTEFYAFRGIYTSVDAGASLGASLRELASEAAAVCVHS